MQGPLNEAGHLIPSERGIIPRALEYIFSRIEQEEQESFGKTSFLVKCSYIEIYNENIFDLLAIDTSQQCFLREDLKKGVYVEGNVEEMVTNAAQALYVYEKGAKNRHVSATTMNHESSRSHAIFTLFIQSKNDENGVTDYRESRFNLVDLAGSERQQSTGTVGVRLKEAGNINKSLLALSNVINALVEISNGRQRHVHYRDSKLTFILRDSLGGNSKTRILANVTPSISCLSETYSTLRFAQRAKQIKNKV